MTPDWVARLDMEKVPAILVRIDVNNSMKAELVPEDEFVLMVSMETREWYPYWNEDEIGRPCRGYADYFAYHGDEHHCTSIVDHFSGYDFHADRYDRARMGALHWLPLSLFVHGPASEQVRECPSTETPARKPWLL